MLEGGRQVISEEVMLARLAQKSQRGISLVELIIFIVIVGVALVGILSVMNTVNRGSADPMVQKQALAIADSLLEEIELQDFSMPSGVTATSGPVTAANRSSGYHIISEYNGFAMSGITSVNGTSAPGLGNYDASVTVASQVLGSIPATSSVLITVTVQPPSGDALRSSGYRVDY